MVIQSEQELESVNQGISLARQWSVYPLVLLPRSRGKLTVPTTVADYSKYKCGCDLTDQKRSLDTVLTQTYKWYIVMFHWTLDQAVINECVIYCRENNVEKQGMREFNQDLTEKLVTAGGLQLDMIIDDRYTARVVLTRLKTTTQEDEYQSFIAVMNKVSPYRLVGQHFIDVCTQYREQ